MIKTLTTTILSILLLLTAVSAQSADPGNGGSRTSFRPTRSQITEAQQKLKSDGAYAGEADGRYNDGFRDSLKGYQIANGLEGTGKLDKQTLAKLGIDLTDSQKGIAPKRGPGSGRQVFRVNKEQLSEAQAKLTAASLYKGPQDGKYNKELRAAIREFQSSNGLRRSGSLNRVTLEKMGIELTESQAAIPANPKDLASGKPTSSKGRRIFRASKDQISTVQQMLASKGLYSGQPTGKLNPDTRDAIKRWQGDNDVKVTGTLNKETLLAMGIPLTEAQKEM